MLLRCGSKFIVNRLGLPYSLANLWDLISFRRLIFSCVRQFGQEIAFENDIFFKLTKVQNTSIID